MRIAIDLDGTAFEWPEEFQRLIKCLVAGGACVVFLTAAAGELPPQARPTEVARRIASRLPLANYVGLVCCESHEKGDWLTKNGFDMIIDDNHVADWAGLRLHPVCVRS